MKRIFLVLITAFTLMIEGCANSKRVVIAQKQLPSWYINPPKSNAQTLYALGEGKNKREAVDNALSLLASTLSVSISSVFDAKSVVKEGSQNSNEATYVNQTKSEVQKVRITNYEILNAAQLGFRHEAVLIEADKRKVFLGLQDALEQKFLMLENEEKAVQKENALKKLSFYQKAFESLVDVPNTLIVMKVLNENFNAATYLKKMNFYRKKYNSLHSKITFSIKAASNAVMFKKLLAKGLNRAGFKIQDRQDSFHFVITLKASIRKTESYGFSIARGVITLTTNDANNNIVATNVLHVDGQSSQGYAIALQDLAKKLDKIIQRNGIAKVLLINI